MDILGVMLDCSRNSVYTADTVKRFIDALSAMGYNALMLYTEDTYEIKGRPYFGYMRGRYSREELKEIVAYGKEKGIELIPCIQTLAHLNQIFRWSEFESVHDIDDILLADDEKTYAFIEDMLKTMRDIFDSDYIHIGMDEAHNAGLGKYLAKHGFTNRFEILSRHLNRVFSMAQNMGFTPIIWSDMFFRFAADGIYHISDPDIITDKIARLVPDSTELVYWDYYSDSSEKYETMLKAHEKFFSPLWFAGGAWKWTGFAPHNGVSVRRTALALDSCKNHGVRNVIITLWGDDGDECSLFSVLTSLFFSAEYYHGCRNMRAIKQKFEKTFGIGFDDMCMLDLPSLAAGAGDKRIDNIDKIMLYNDPLLGIYDGIAEKVKNGSKYYANCSKKLKSVKNNNYGYLFETLSALCDLLEIKFSLGADMRAAYKTKDKSRLRELIHSANIAAERLEVFHKKFRAQWEAECKRNGFEIQDIRLGGLRARLLRCVEILQDYCDGKTEKIDEFEEELLCFDCPEYYDNNWMKIASANVLSQSIHY